jgi:phage-related protein
VKQTVVNDNRRMLLEMMMPINQQLNEMKLLYENTKTCSTEVGSKIDELKKIIQLQQNSLTGGAVPHNPVLHGQINPAQLE